MLNRFWFIFCLFFVSGAYGLIYQVVWSRMMSLIFGRSVLAVGIVLAAFMAGLACAELPPRERATALRSLAEQLEAK